MPVNPNSVIDTWVNTYRPDFYTALTDQEDWTYTNFPSLLTQWQAQFTNLMNEMNTWKNYNRGDIRDYILNLHAYVVNGQQFGRTFVVNNADAWRIFSMKDFTYACVGRAINYYNDLVETPPMSGIWVSAKMDADVNTVSTFLGTENTRLRTTLPSVAQEASTETVINNLFETETLVDVKTKQEIGTYVFTTLNWKAVLNTITYSPAIPIPPYV